MQVTSQWTPASVFEALRAGEAHLFPVPDGFAILTSASPYCHIWIAASYSGVATNLYNSLTTIETIAQECGFSGVSFATDRKGWQRVAPKLGFRLSEDGRHYLKEFTDES